MRNKKPKNEKNKINSALNIFCHFFFLCFFFGMPEAPCLALCLCLCVSRLVLYFLGYGTVVTRFCFLECVWQILEAFLVVESLFLNNKRK